MKVVSVQRHSGVHGGGELVAAWILEALKDEHELTVFSWEEPPWELLNRYYGTSLSAGQVRFVAAPRSLRVAFRLAGSERFDSARFQKFAALMRVAREVVAEHDLAISPLDEIDFGVPGLQYVHYPWAGRAVGAEGSLAGGLRRRRPWMHLAAFSAERVRANATAANSEYTANAIRAQLGVEPEVIYPPCPGPFSPRPWDERADTVVMVGRLIPEKRLDLAIDVVRAARARGAELRLLMVGRAERRLDGQLREVRRLLSSEPWIEVCENPDRPELLDAVGSARYGIHPAGGEPYGIAVAEMVRAGCIPITRRDGGPPEITGGDERLLFDTPEEGAERLLALMRSEADRAELQAQLRRREAVIAPEEFVRRIRSWVAGTVQRLPGEEARHRARR